MLFAAPLLVAPFVGWLLAMLIGRVAEQHVAAWFYPVAVAAACAVAAWAIVTFGTSQQTWLTCLLGWTLLALSWIDALCFRLPDILTLPLLLIGLGVAFLTQPDEMVWHGLGAAFGYLALRGIAIAYRVLRGREGLGVGDAKLLAAAGAWLGIAALPWLVLIAASVALVWAGGSVVAGRPVGATTALPFGPFLAAAFWLLWLYGGSWELM